MFRYVAINIFGSQIISTQTGAEHRRHKNVVKGCFNETIMETAYTGMVDALTTMIREEGLENGGMFEDTREMMIKVCPMSSLLISLGALLECGAWLMDSSHYS
jgi:fluoride ion exporter CrcB/FEX